jgi:SAM-dependent methyltransferase
VNKNAIPDCDLYTGRFYDDKTLLASRIEIHQRYTVPPIDFVQWVLNLVPWRGDERVVDVGCGSGNYVGPVAERLSGASGHKPQATQHVLGDISLRGLRDLRRRSGPPVINLDVVALPFSDGFCDVILANHVLHDAPDVDRAPGSGH